MKTFFEEPILPLIRFEAKDVLTASPNVAPGQDEDELPFNPNNP